MSGCQGAPRGKGRWGSELAALQSQEGFGMAAHLREKPPCKHRGKSLFILLTVLKLHKVTQCHQPIRPACT